MGIKLHGNDPLWTEIERAARANLDPSLTEPLLFERFGETRAVMVLDSVGFSRTTRARGIVHFLMLIARMRRIVGQALKDKGAEYLTAWADNMYAEFSDPDQAVAAAFEAHLRLADAAIALDSDRLFGVCIGIGYGPLLRSEREGLFGDQMNLASKLGEDTAEQGETLLTRAAFDGLREKKGLLWEQRAITVSGLALPYFMVQPEPQGDRPRGMRSL